MKQKPSKNTVLKTASDNLPEFLSLLAVLSISVLLLFFPENDHFSNVSVAILTGVVMHFIPQLDKQPGESSTPKSRGTA